MTQTPRCRLLGGSARWARQLIGHQESRDGLAASWHTDHWLVSAPDSIKRGQDASSGPSRWVVMPDGSSQAITGQDSEDIVIEQLHRGNRGHHQFTLRPSAFCLVAFLLGAFTVLHVLWLDPAPWAWRDPEGRDIWTALARSLATADWAAAWQWGFAVAGLTLLGVAIHEAGHGVAAEIVGDRWVTFSLGLYGAAVRCYPVPDGWRRVGLSVAGPAAQLVLRILMAATLSWEPAGDVWRSPNPNLVYPIWWIPGLTGVAPALSNLIPIRGLGTDGAKILDGLRSVLVGKRSS